ncbi:NUDIX domain-containing protein [Candidatus Peregrinibacteria bacterium]|jgi:bis(5'-nucleosidyl)-tetraphosphatase|nr:NUDIX domain-containing protein [Candidatus Peregrinibacteria bacterium]MBT5823745.1 NUDIX domain-containing protein [Candidatus Peregrinibacteria bacterium]
MKNKHQAKGPVKSVVKEKSCGVILYRIEEGIRQYLLLHYPSGHWDFPKGHVEDIDEHEMATAQRELEEETGIEDIDFIEGYREPMYYEFRRGKKQLVKKVVVYFLAETKEKDVKISFEHKDFLWLPYQEAFDKLTFDNAKGLIEKGEKHLLE